MKNSQLKPLPVLVAVQGGDTESNTVFRHLFFLPQLHFLLRELACHTGGSLGEASHGRRTSFNLTAWEVSVKAPTEVPACVCKEGSDLGSHA